MKLITEVFNEDCAVLTESNEDGKKAYYIEGPFMQGDIQNRNGRIYPGSILEKEMNRYNEAFIKTRRALGELGHPEGPQINGDRVSHRIVEMKRDGSNFNGKAKILGTPMGEIVKTFIDEGVKVGVSTRGLGSVKASKNGIMEVQDDFHLATVDIVTDPSGPNCFVNGIMENTEYFFDIAQGSWKIAPGQVATPVDIIEDTNEKVVEVISQFNSEEAFQKAMKMLESLEATVKDMKKNYKKTERIDESKASDVMEKFIRSLK